MKKIRYIFVFIFLSGMLFTVIRYLPILEEETPAQKVELAKKTSQEDTSSDDDSNDDDPDNEKTDLFFDQGCGSINALQSEYKFQVKHTSYNFPVANITTPPPRV